MAENGMTIEASSLAEFLSVIYEKAAERAGTETDAVKDAVKTMIENAETSMKNIAQEDLQPLRDAAEGLLKTTPLWVDLSNYFQQHTTIAKKYLEDGRKVQGLFDEIKSKITVFQEKLDEVQNKITFLLYVTDNGDLLLGDEIKILENASSWKTTGGNASVVTQSMATIAKLNADTLTNWTNLKMVRQYFLQDPTEARIALSNSFTQIKNYNVPLFTHNKKFWYTFWNKKNKVGSTLFPVCKKYVENDLTQTEIAFWIQKASNGAVNEAYSQILFNAAFGINPVLDETFDQTNEGQVKFYDYMKDADNKPGATSSDLMYSLNNIQQALKDFQINFSIKGSRSQSQSWQDYYALATAIILRGDDLTILDIERFFKENNDKYNTKLVQEVTKEKIKTLKAAAKKKG